MPQQKEIKHKGKPNTGTLHLAQQVKALNLHSEGLAHTQTIANCKALLEGQMVLYKDYCNGSQCEPLLIRAPSVC